MTSRLDPEYTRKQVDDLLDDKQPLNSNLTDISALTPAPFGLSLLETTDATDARTVLGVASTLPSLFNVTDFGAVGDDVTDDTAAIQAALDAADSSNGGLVYFPCGTYLTTGTLALPMRTTMWGAGRDCVIIDYTGTSTAVQMKDPGTAEQKLYPVIQGLTILAYSATTGINAKGMTMGRLRDVKIDGSSASSSTAPASGTVGVLWDGSYGASIGAWWNIIEGCWITGWDTCVKSTGVAAAGQANANIVRSSRITHHNIGFDIDVGDTNTIQNCDITSAVSGAVGVRINDAIARVVNNRTESSSSSTFVQVTASASKWVIEDNSIFNSGTGVSLATGTLTQGGRMLNNAYGSSSPATRVSSVDTSITSSGTSINRIGPLFPLFFYRADVAASLSSSVVNIAGAVDSGGTGVSLNAFGRSYQIRGISVRMSAARTAGTLTVKPTIGGTESTTLSATIDGTNTTNISAYQSMAKDTNGGNSGVGVKVTTDGSWAPTTSDLFVTVWVEELPY